MIVPWRDRHGRFLPLKAVVLAAGFIPGAVLAFWWANGMLGGRPVTEVIHGTGDWAIRYPADIARDHAGGARAELASAAAGAPDRRADRARLCAGASLAVRGGPELSPGCGRHGDPAAVLSDDRLRYLLGLGVLGVTSTNGWIQRLGRWWKRLHRAIYVLGAIALLHYFIQSKSNVSEPVFFSGLFVWLMLWRALPMAWQRSLIAQLALSRGGGVRSRRHRVRLVCGGDRRSTHGGCSAANETLRFGLRPAHYVALVGLAVSLLAGLRLALRLLGPRPRLAPSRS